MYSYFPFDRSDRKRSGRTTSGQFLSADNNRRWLLSGVHPAHATPGPQLAPTSRVPLADPTATSLGQLSGAGTTDPTATGLDSRGLDEALQSVPLPAGMMGRLHQLVDELPDA